MCYPYVCYLDDVLPARVTWMCYLDVLSARITCTCYLDVLPRCIIRMSVTWTTYYMDVFTCTCYLDVLPRYVTCMCVIRMSVTWTDLPACVT